MGSATLTGNAGNTDSRIILSDRSVCGEIVQGRATFTTSTLQDVNVEAQDTASLTVSRSTFRDSGANHVNELLLLDESSGRLSANSLGVHVRLNSPAYSFEGNSIGFGQFDVSDLGPRERTLGEIDSVSRYRLVDDVTRQAYDAGECVVERESLMIEDGAVLELGTSSISILGRKLDVEGATLTSTGSEEESILLERTPNRVAEREADLSHWHESPHRLLESHILFISQWLISPHGV